MPRTADPGRRDAIVEVAHVVFARKGYGATGIADLAGELGIGHGTVYRYFDNKREVAEAVLDRAIGRVAAVVSAESPTATQTVTDYRSQVERIGHRLFDLFVADPALGRLLFHDLATVDSELRDRLSGALDLFADFTAAYLTNGVSKGFLRPQLDVEVTARLVNSMVFEGAVQVCAAADPEALRNRWISAVVSLMFDGVAAR